MRPCVHPHLEQTVAVVRSLGQTSRILLAPDQRLPNDFVLVGAKEMPQEAFGGLLVNERGKAGACWASPGVQLDHMMAVINASLKRWRVPHFSNTRTKPSGDETENSQHLIHSKLRAS